MSSVQASARGASYDTFLLVPILLFFGLLTVAVLRSPSLITSSGIGSAEIVVAPLILVDLRADGDRARRPRARSICRSGR